MATIVRIMAITLQWRNATSFPVYAESLRPETFATLSTAELPRLSLPVGNTTAELGELFTISGALDDEHLILEGSMPSLGWIGRGMASGRLTIRGNVGPGLGATMSGGTIAVTGNVGNAAGAGMRGGTLSIVGNAGHQLGAAEPGARLGMRDGLILVRGNIGDDAGLALRRGVIAVEGNAGEGLGRAMIAGSIVVFGQAGTTTGIGMKRGTIALFDEAPAKPFFPFQYACRYRPPVMTILLRSLRSHGFLIPSSAFDGSFERYNGDMLEGGRGELLVWSA
jgi:formylmethanofuran dehydrogenase subunit C